jgi:hypothetical protein
MRQSEPPLPQTDLPSLDDHAAEPEVLATAVVTAKVKVKPLKPRPVPAIAAGSKHGR